MCSNAGYARGGGGSTASGAKPIMESRQEADGFFGVDNGVYRGWRDSLSSNEYDSLRGYTGSWYIDINGYLRGDYELDEHGSMGTKIKKDVKMMDKAIKRFEIQEDITVRRGSSAQLLGGLTDPDEINAVLKGKTVRDKGYMSTSAVKGGNFSGEIQYEIKVGKGKGKGAYVAPLSKHSSEHEFLLARGTNLKVLGARKEGSKTIVSLEC